MGFLSFPFSAVVSGSFRPINFIFLPRFRRRSTYRFRVFPVHPYDGGSDYLIMVIGVSLSGMGVCLMGIGISLMVMGVSLMSIGVSPMTVGVSLNGHWCESDEHWSRPVAFREMRFVNWFHRLSVRFVVSFWFSKNRFRVWFHVLSSHDS